MRNWNRAFAMAVMLVTGVAVQSGGCHGHTVLAQERASLTGTWVILLEGHQVGLEVEDTSGVLEATLHIMGQRVLLDGEVKDAAFTLTSDAQVGDNQSHGALVKMRLTGTHKPDDTLEGSIDMPRGPMKWTAERLKKP